MFTLPVSAAGVQALCGISLLKDGMVMITFDFRSAYTQTPRVGAPVYAELPQHFQTEGMRRMKREGGLPVVPLEKWFYGEPGAGD